MLHVFGRSCNLISSEGGLISLVSQEIGEGPFSIVLPTISISRYVTADSDVECQDETLTVGELVIDTTPAQVWDPSPDWHGLRRKVNEIRSKIHLLIDILRTLAPGGGLAEMVLSQPDSPPSANKGIFRPARFSIQKIVDGLQSADKALCMEAAFELAGCGEGLTPEGDDFLLGCLLALRILYEDRLAEGLADAIVEAATGRTTILSAEWLRSAARGECAGQWHALFKGLLQDRSEPIEAAARAIVRQGHTSGSAAMAGFTAALS